jgi:hypothetical protein
MKSKSTLIPPVAINQAVPQIRHVDADPDPACHFDADLNRDPACHFDANPDPDPTFHFDADLIFHIFWPVVCKMMRIRIQLITLMRIWIRNTAMKNAY